ncbi:unnamed protein product [Caretta caretta]
MTFYALSNGMRETISRMEVPSKSQVEHFMDMGGSDKVDQPIAMPEADKWVSKMTLWSVERGLTLICVTGKEKVSCWMEKKRCVLMVEMRSKLHPKMAPILWYQDCLTDQSCVLVPIVVILVLRVVPET